MLLEIFGITLLIPLLNFISDETMCNQTCENIFSYFEINIDQFTFLKLILLSLLFVFFIKTFFVTYLIYKQNQTILNLLSSLAKKLFKYYINQTYLYHVEKNPAILIRNINQEVSAVVTNYLNSLLSLLMEILVCIGIVIILFIYQPYGLLLASVVFGILSILFSIFTKKKVKAWGKVRQENEQKKIKNLIQAFNSIKEIKLYSKEEYFEKINRITFDTHASINTKNSVLNAVIRPWLEFFFIFTIVILVSFLILNGNSINTIFATLALFGAAAFKLLPSVNKILVNTQSMRFTQNAVDLIYNEFSNIIDLSENNLKDSSKIDFNNISFNDISVKYPSRDNLSIKNINFSINKNQIIGIVGLSGAGKSTLIDTLIGLVPPRSGEIKVNNQDQNLSKNEWKNCIGYVPQNIYLVDDSIINNIAFGVQKKDISIEKINETIKVVQLEKFITELKQGYETYVGDKGVKLSGGQKQRIGIARALYNNPSILILDEATSSLDIFTEKEIMDFIFSLKGQITVVIVSHRLTTVEKCDYIYELENGSISYEGKAKNVIDKINKKYNS